MVGFNEKKKRNVDEALYLEAFDGMFKWGCFWLLPADLEVAFACVPAGWPRLR